MSCSEVRSLLALRSLELLEEEERGSVESHLAACPACRLEVGSQDEIASYFRSARRDEKPPERVWDALVTNLGGSATGSPLDQAAPVAVAAPKRPLLDLACARCSGGLELAVYCSSCLAPHHEECFSTCGVRGCKGTQVVSARPPRRSYGLPLVTVGIAAIVAVSFLQRGYDESVRNNERLLEESQRNAQLESDLRKFVASRTLRAPQKAPEKVSIRCRDEDLGAVLDKIGKQCQQSIVALPDVRAKVSVTLDDVPWRNAVTMLAETAKCKVLECGQVLVLEKSEQKTELPPFKVPPVASDPRDFSIPAPSVEMFRFPDGREVPEELVHLTGIVASERALLPSTVMIGNRSYREGDQVLGRDGKPLSPAVYVVKIETSRVELASGSREGPKAARTVGGSAR